MSKPALLCAVFLNLVPCTTAQAIPEQLRGKWIVERVLPTSTISCWGNRESKQLIGTEIQYSADSFQWKNMVTAHPDVTVVIVSASQFQSEHSGGGASGSKVSFRQLGIRAAVATQIILGHPDASITGATTEIPGDTLLMKNQDAIIFSVCNVYFEARRERVNKITPPQ